MTNALKALKDFLKKQAVIPTHFQERVNLWILGMFGGKPPPGITVCQNRFLEEALEAVQTFGMTKEQAHAMVNFVYAREAAKEKEVIGGVMVTLAALCNAFEIDMIDSGERELDKIWGMIDIIREKQALKPVFLIKDE